MLPASFRVHLFFWAGPQPLQQNLAKRLSRQLPEDAFPLQVKQRSQNFAGIQPSRFYQLIDGLSFVHA